MNAWRSSGLAAASTLAALVACGHHPTGTAPPGAAVEVGASDASIGGDAQVDGGTCPIEGSFGPTCDVCVAEHCCAEYGACFTTAECIDVNDCTATCDESVGEGGADAGDCRTACKARNPDAALHFEAWDECVATRCPTQCMF